MKTILEIASGSEGVCEHIVKTFDSLEEIKEFLRARNNGDSFGYGFIDSVSGDIFAKDQCPLYSISFNIRKQTGLDYFHLENGSGDNARKSRRERDKMYKRFLNDHLNGRCVLQAL